jgi:hypothetical protein
MYTCGECSDRLLDLLYGLLDAGEALALREHAAGCAACQAALAEAETQQRLFARAAQVVRELPPFVAPSDQAEAATPAPRPAELPAEPVAASPATIALPPPRRIARRRWPWLATAAALLLLAGGGYWAYESGLETHRADLARARNEVKALDARLASATRTYEQELAQLPAQVQARQLRVQVIGPTHYQADGPGQVRVVTQHADGTPAAAQVSVELLDESGARKLGRQELQSSGEAVVPLPPGLAVKPGEKTRLAARAETRRGAEVEIKEELVAAGPTYLTHIALNKPVYRVGDVVLFRTLTLDRFNLKPPEREFRVNYILRDAQHRPVRQFQRQTGPDGVGGGEFALTGDLAAGEYTVEIAPAAAAGAGLAAQRRHFRVAHEQVPALAGLTAMQPQFQFDRPNYEPGDKVRAELFFHRGQEKGGAANQSVTVKAADPAGRPIPVNGAPPGKPFQTNTDAQGRASFELRLPQRIPAGKPVVEVELHDGTANARYRQAIPVGTSQPDVAFFPEGGELVAGVENRVYFRAQGRHGEPAGLSGQVVDRQGLKVARVQKEREAGEPAGAPGLGWFTFAPRRDETYTLQIPAPDNTTVVVPLPPVRAAGVVLSVPEAVGREGEPIRAVVRSPGPERPVLVLASCRGHVVDQQFVTSSPAGTEVRLQPAAGTRGVVRVTVYEVDQDRLVPRAERLAYRVPTERLVVSVANAAKAGGAAYRAGGHVDLTLKAVNEKGEPAAACFFAAVVDQQALAPGRHNEQGPPAFFFLTSEIPGGDELEHADFLVSDTPPARTALDLFLGTHGWRRFAEHDAATLLARAGRPANAAAVDPPAVFRRDNVNDMKARYEAALARAREELLHKADQQRQALQEESDEHTRAVATAAAALREYEELPCRYGRMAAGVVVLLLLAAGGTFLVVGFIRAIRGSRPTVAFGSAFASLLLCLVTYGVNSYLGQPGSETTDLLGRAQLPKRQLELAQLPQLNQAPGDKRGEIPADPSAPVGRFAEVAGEPVGAPPNLESRTTSREAKVADALMGAGTGGGAGAAKEPSAARKEASDDMAKRLNQSPKKGDQPYGGFLPPGGAPAPPPVAPTSAPGAAPKMKAAGKAAAAQAKTDGKPTATAEARGGKDAAPSVLFLRQYSYRQDRAAGNLQDTVLWCPAVVAPDGTAQIAFDLLGHVTAYRVLLYAHSPSGRLGTYQGQIEARK